MFGMFGMNGHPLAKMLAERLYPERYKLVGIEVAKAMQDHHISSKLAIGGMAHLGKMYANFSVAENRKIELTDNNIEVVGAETTVLAEEIKKAIGEATKGKSNHEIIAALYSLALQTVEAQDKIEKAIKEEHSPKFERCDLDCANCSKAEEHGKTAFSGKGEASSNPLDEIIDILKKVRDAGGDVEVHKF